MYRDGKSDATDADQIKSNKERLDERLYKTETDGGTVSC